MRKKSMEATTKRRAAVLLAVLLASFFVLCGCTEREGASTGSIGKAGLLEGEKAGALISFEENGYTAEVAFVRKVDGDTAVFETESGSRIKVRFLAVDTPETVKEGTEVQAWGPEASEYTGEILAEAGTVFLEFDPEADLTDSYGRYLAWVWADGFLLEEGLVKNGYAKVAYAYGDYKYLDVLYDVQEAAKLNRAGIWSGEEDL